MNRIIWIVFAIISLDMMGIGLIIPVVAPMLLESNSPFLSPEISTETRIVLQGIALSLYPFFQFFGAPLLGIWADRKGRKPMLILTLLGTAFGYFLATISFVFGALWIFFLSRALDGFTGGNISIANAVIADISTEKEKAKNFGMIGAAFGTGIVIGPFLGGILSDSSLVSWFSYQTPFIFAMMLSVFNIFLVWKFLPETLKNPRKTERISWVLGFAHLKKAFLHPSLQKLFVVLFLHISGFAFFTNFFQVFAIEKFGMTAKDIGLLFAFLGVCIIFAQIVILRFVSRYFSIAFWIKMALLGLSATLLVLPFVSAEWQFFPIFFAMALCNGVLFANFTALISSQVPANEQGEIMGIKESLNAFGNAVPALFASIFGAFSVSAPFFISAILLFFAWFLFRR